MLSFTQVDVFTDELLSGNPVAVVHGADELTTEQMAAFARWTNLSETTFLLSPTDPAADYRLRIFTTARELPFAGHPTIGSARAWLAAGATPKTQGRLVQECGAGLVSLRRNGNRLAFAAPPLLRGGPVEPETVDAVAAALGVAPGEIVDAQWADNGPGWVAVLLADADAVLNLTPDPTAFGRYTDVGVVGPYPPGGDVAFEVRAFVVDDGFFEDPVTGSLNAAIAQWLIPAGRAPSAYTASQGTKLRRRGRVHVERAGDDIWIGGDTVVGITGTVAL
ncbi:PhzF family phenazine biosynthesis protein [Actinophytocola sp.]|uniref:PhzF family phenazine biosynthesis protein n=1 Tax=Actinophytocola sp. TaxID=1872138 RepID=UPI003D6AB50D